MARWWGKKRMPEGVKAVPSGQDSSTDSVHGTLPGQVDGSGGLRTVLLCVHDSGLMLTTDDDGGGAQANVAPRMYPWAEITHVWFANDLEGHSTTEGDAIVTQWVYIQRLEFADGTVVTSRLADPPVTTPGAVFRTGQIADRPPSSIWPLLAHIQARVTEVQLANVNTALAAGGPVQFGPLTADEDGLHHQDTHIPWEDITALRYSFVHAGVDEDELGAYLRMEFRDREAGTYGFPFRWLRIPALDVPDIGVLERLYAERRL
ncbi:hypothetical protein AB0D62_21255 [Streptomyces massasporeus]|uniref:hypothetical protein n=1 Tax=Streptomyces massasporeus TaxID=67324 RepID=UPI0033E2A617